MARRGGGGNFIGVEIEGLSSFVRGASKADAALKPSLKKAGKKTADLVADRTRSSASGPWAAVYDGLRASSALFGGRRRKTTMQFKQHRGTTGYTFWPTVRRSRGDIAKHYLNEIDDVLNELDTGDRRG